MADARIRHATETFVNNLIDSVKKLIKTNTDQINVLSGKIDIGILRSGTLADYILKHGRNGGVGGNTHEASMTDLPEQRWGMFHVMKHASEVWTVIWYSDYNSTHYKRQLRSEGWVTEWEPIATTSKTDILCTQCSGWTVTEQSSYIINNVVYINVVVRSETPMQIGVQQYPFTVPINYKPKASVVMCGLHLREGGAILINTHGVNGSLWNNGGFYFFNNIEGAQDIRFTGVYAI